MADVTAPPASSNGETNNAVEEVSGVKVYAGNLAYAVKDEELKDFFAPVQSEILTCQVIMHGSRSAGYGFVALASHEAAQKACDALNGKDLLGRTVNVQVAKDAEEKEKDKSERKDKGRVGRRGNKAAAGEVTEAEANGEVEKTTGSSANGDESKPKKKKKAPRKKKTKAAPNGTADAAETEVATDAPAPAIEAEKKPKKPKRAPRPKRAPGEEPTGVPSKSNLFVANLPFSVDDAALGSIFTDAGFTVSSARVVRMRWGHPRKSRGYGFVDVGGEDAQLQAIEKLNNKELEGGRIITVKVAVDQQREAEELEQETNTA